MQLENQQILPKLFHIPDNFIGRITLYANCKITENEIILFNSALKVMSNYIIDNNIDITNCYKFNIFFTYDGSFTLIEDNENVCGNQFQIASYNMKKLRQISYTEMMFAYIEELAHYFLKIYDETLIKYKCEEIIRYVLPDFQFESMLKRWNINGF